MSNEAMKRALIELKNQMRKHMFDSPEEETEVSVTEEPGGTFGAIVDEAFSKREPEVEGRRLDRTLSEEPEGTFDKLIEDAFEKDRSRKRKIEDSRMRPDIVIREKAKSFEGPFKKRK